MNTLQMITEKRVIAIIRGVPRSKLLRLADALVDGGVSLIELTFEQAASDCVASTAHGIEMLRRSWGEAISIGAGTVLTPDQLTAACQAGAEYIISPNTDVEIVQQTKRMGLISIPGAMTPSEIIQANKAGADLVKVFPANFLGTNFIRDIRAPLGHISFVATCGIREDNIAEYLRAGYTAAGISGRLVDKELIRDEQYGEISRRAQAFSRIVASLKDEE